MSDHAHLLLTPSPNISLEKANAIHQRKFLLPSKKQNRCLGAKSRQPRITDNHDYNTHLTYIHQNPIRAKLTTQPELYTHSTANPNHISDASPTHFS
jgi:putative transposase